MKIADITAGIAVANRRHFNESVFSHCFGKRFKKNYSVIEINIISATPGISTQEQILELIKTRHTGITVKEIRRILNRPISMIQVCLKDLIASKAIFTRKNKAGVGLIYYPNKAAS